MLTRRGEEVKELTKDLLRDMLHLTLKKSDSDQNLFPKLVDIMIEMKTMASEGRKQEHLLVLDFGDMNWPLVFKQMLDAPFKNI